MMNRRHFFMSGAALVGSTSFLRAAGRSVESVFQGEGGSWSLWEDVSRRDGGVELRAPDGRALSLSRFMESCEDRKAGYYCGLDFGKMAYAERDLLAEQLLKSGGDPDQISVREAAPPVDSNFSLEQEGRLVWTSFVGTIEADEVMPLTPAGNTRNWHINRVAPELSAKSGLVSKRSEGLLGGAAPIIVKQFPLNADSYWEVLVFAEVETDTPHLVPTWERVMLVERGEVKRVIYGSAYVPFGKKRKDPDAAMFHAALLRCVLYWQKELAGTFKPNLPEQDWTDFAQHAFVKEKMVRGKGVTPRYGVVDRDYGGSEYDGFQDIFTSSLLANLEWGRFADAKAILENQFESFVGDDGLVAMRGPEVGQTGLTLALLARYYDLTGNVDTLRKYKKRIAAMAGVLTDLHDQALQLAPHNPGYGLLHGWSESDACLFPDPSVWWKPYFGNTSLAAKGLLRLARLWSVLAPEEGGLKADWEKRASQLTAQLEASLRASIRHDLKPAYVPILPGVRETFRESLSKHPVSEQQWAHRVYCELLQGGVLPADMEAMVIKSMQGHGATVMGNVGNLTAPNHEQRDILGFISYGYAEALLRHDRIEDYLLFLYAHRYHAHTRGSWTAAEVAGLRGDLALFCLPAQMTVPILLRWALVYEDDTTETLHLARALPTRWLLSGETVAVERVKTRWGEVSYAMTFHANKQKLSVDVTLPQGAPKDVKLHIRMPKGGRVCTASVEGVEAHDFGLLIDGSKRKAVKLMMDVA